MHPIDLRPESTRRGFLGDVGMGFAGLALGAMLHRDGIARGAEPSGRRTSPPGPRVSSGSSLPAA